MALDEATMQLLAQMADGGGKPLHEMTVEEARALSGSLNELYGPGPEMHNVADGRVAVSGGVVPIRLLVPTERPGGVIVYYHGGGWVIGAIDDVEPLGRQLAERTGCAVVLVDYRLAPEYRFPTAVDDAWAALGWVDAHLEEIAGTRVPLIVAGDSAGGNLAAVMSQRAKGRGGPPIALQVLVYPVTDCDFATTSYLHPDNQLLLTRDAMVWFWDHYVPDPLVRVHPDASPLRNPEVSLLPAAVILTAEHDPLRDEGEVYATVLRKAGVSVKHRRFAGQMHGFFPMVNVLPGSAAGIDYVVAAIEESLAGRDAMTSSSGER
jgi:acetyl esterase